MTLRSRPLAVVTGLAVVGMLAIAARSTPKREPAPQQEASNPTADLLVELIRANTSNPPGNTGSVANLLAPKFKALGFEVDIVQTPDSGKAHFIARLRGNGSKRPVLIAAHADVVGVEREKWTVDPFAAVVKDGYVFGRGALDFKGGMAVFARAAMMVAERKVPLDRDIIFLAEADEESGPYSTTWLASQAWQKIDCEFALNEGGWIMKGPDGRVRYVSISTADKSAIPIILTAKGTSTHASMPRPDNAIFALARGLAKISAYETPLFLTPSTRQFFQTLAKTSQPPMSGYFADLLGTDSARVKRADREISKDPLLHALMRNTLAPVLMNAGFRGNVIPGSAEATINARLIPGAKAEDVVRDLKRVIGDSTIDVRASNTIPWPQGLAPSSENTDLYRALAKSARQQFSADVTPYLFQAGTDAPTWRSRGIPVYGIYPYPIDAEDLTRMHGNDERVSIEGLQQGTEMIYRALVDVAGRR
ncbi:MAG TPA: M20/M25/M40 family metallo-hydrolase [Gemmatimonadaceae bacterium]|jgi:acetylornithine deacetylase/succinyl-diaminopimelate desuccinylase-like protein|nr:M20/M25/M40 family metallo-hydrolase [Gemmatimonadaceae bacterium]